MTKRNNAIEILTILILTALTASAQTKPKVVFIGDNVTFNWSSAFAANKNWINEGVSIPPTSFPIQGSSSVILNRFRTDVINLHPAIVHIMIGVDDADIDDDAQEKIILPDFLKNLEQMVNLAKAANIQVILGIESPEWAYNGPVESINSIVATLGVQNNIPVINYADALCVCVSSTGGFVVTSYMMPQPNTGAYEPTPAGYALMTQMAEATINTLSLTLQSGYLQNVQKPDSNQGTLIPANGIDVNIVHPAAVIQFTPIGQYEGGLVEPLINSSYAGSTGTWESSKPLVMYISETGLATALSPGYAVITYKSPSGVAFNSWVMDVQGQE